MPNIKTVAPQFRGIPKLDGDTADMPARCKLERRIVWNLIRHLFRKPIRSTQSDQGD